MEMLHIFIKYMFYIFIYIGGIYMSGLYVYIYKYMFIYTYINIFICGGLCLQQ